MTSGGGHRPVRILMLATDCYGGHGGIALYNRDTIEALAASDEVAEVIVLPRVISHQLDRAAIPAKVRFVEAAAGGGFAYVRALMAVVARGGFDLIYCGHVNLAPLARVAAAITRCPWLLAIYGIDAWTPSNRKTVRWAIRGANRVLSISKVTLDRFLAFNPVPLDRTVIVPNAIHLDEYAAVPRNPQLAERFGVTGKPVVMTFGRLNPQERYKGFDEIIEIMPRLLGQVGDLVFLIAGGGEDRARLEQKAADLGVARNVVFTSYVEEREKADVYRLADAFVLAGRGEGFGFVLLEAMACGIPVVASTLDGSREAVRDGLLGPTVDPTDRDALVEAILTALARLKGIPDGLSYFSYPSFAERMRAAVLALAR